MVAGPPFEDGCYQVGCNSQILCVCMLSALTGVPRLCTMLFHPGVHRLLILNVRRNCRGRLQG